MGIETAGTRHAGVGQRSAHFWVRQRPSGRERRQNRASDSERPAREITSSQNSHRQSFFGFELRPLRRFNAALGYISYTGSRIMPAHIVVRTAKASFVASSAQSISAAVCAVERNILWRGFM